MENTIYWIWLSMACRPSGTTFGKLIKEFNGAKEIYEAESKKISSIIGYKNSDRSALENKDLENATKVYEFCKKHNVGVLLYSDEKYPDALRKIENPPVLLYYRGILPEFNKRFFVAAVGTRSLSDYGRKHTFKISFDLASVGAIIVSGMAIGIDGVAMAGALSSGGSCVAVIGSGIDVCYPPQHLQLAREIVKNGCVLTEYAPGTRPSRFNFPSRNRIISGLSSATIVFEGPEKSGALITARCATEQGRRVYTLPAPIGHKNGELSSLLIKNGAKICTRAEDVINDFTDKFTSTLNPFLLKERVSIDMMSALRKYSVCAVCPGDDIFNPPRTFAKNSTETENKEPLGVQLEDKREPVLPPNGFDKESLKVYKKIPLNSPCTIESLVSDQMNLREVIKHLLKLEVSGFVVLLPGEMVSRKFK